MVQVDGQTWTALENHCPSGMSPRPPSLSAPWTLGNVYSGHRPFEGSLLSLHLDSPGERVDLLRDLHWVAAGPYWLWPERLYQPSTNVRDELLASVWHFAGFACLAYFLAASLGMAATKTRLMLGITVFAVAMTVGKVVVSERHPSLVDLVVNLVGAGVGLYVRHAVSEIRRSRHTGV